MTLPEPMKRNFEVACSFLGWGDPGSPASPGVWFIGLEEHEPWTDDVVARCRGHKFIPEEGSPDYAVASWTSKIIYRLSTSYASPDDIAYRRERLWKRDSHVCQTNLFPLGKGTLASWPNHYQQLFGFGPDERKRYRAAAEKQRYQNIQAGWAASQPQATVCFGKSHWHEFRGLFGLESKSPDPDGTCSYSEKHILLTPFFGQQGRGQAMTGGQADAIATRLRAWNISVP